MPGMLCNGVETDMPYVKNSRAYCEGFYNRAVDAAATNPYDQTATPVDYAEYQRGIDNAAALAGQTLTREQCGCCPGAGIIVPI